MGLPLAGTHRPIGQLQIGRRFPEKPKRFFWSVQGSLRGNRNPLRLFFFCQRFLLEKQKKMLNGSYKFAAAYQPLSSLSNLLHCISQV